MNKGNGGSRGRVGEEKQVLEQFNREEKEGSWAKTTAWSDERAREGLGYAFVSAESRLHDC